MSRVYQLRHTPDHHPRHVGVTGLLTRLRTTPLPLAVARM